MLNSIEEKDQKETKKISSPDKSLYKAVEKIFIRFSSVLRTAQIYEPNNLTFIEHLGPFFASVKNMLKDEGKAIFQFQENTLFFNKNRIKFNYISYHNFKFLADEFRKKEIGTIGFEIGMDDDELTKFIVLLANSKGEKEKPFEDFLAELKAKRISHIFVEKIHPYEIAALMKAKQVKQSAKKLFFKSMTHLKESFEREKQQKKVHLKTSRRLIQSIVNLISRDESFMIGLTNLKNYDDYTVNHSTNVSVLSVCFGRRLGLEKEELLDLGLSAFFHDIGKLEVPKEILEKKDKLTKKERTIMEKHTYQGVSKLINLKEYSYLPVNALYVALEHHLWSNLSGYPKYWKKDKVGLFSKIVKMCDFFDSVTTERPYRNYVLTRDEALSLMLEKSGTEFDPVLLKVFASMLGVYPIGSLVALNTKEIGIVTDMNPEMAFMLRPLVKLITNKKGKKIDGEIVNLIEKNPKTKEYKRTIVKSLNPDKYNIRPSDYFLAQVEQEAS